jgi:hypothetical protein
MDFIKSGKRSTRNVQRSTKIDSIAGLICRASAPLAGFEMIGRRCACPTIAELNVGRLSVERLLKKKMPESNFDPGIHESFTPPMPFRRISRSLLVTGG